MRFVLSHSSSYIPDILKDGYLRPSIKTGVLGFTGEPCKYIYFELLSKYMPRTSQGIQMYFSINILRDFQGYFTRNWIFDPTEDESKCTIIDKDHVMKSLYKCEKISLDKLKGTDFCGGNGNQIAIPISAISVYKYLIGIRDPFVIDMTHYWVVCSNAKKQYEDFYIKRNGKIIPHLIISKQDIQKYLPKKYKFISISVG